MATIIDILIEHGVLGLWIAYMIFRDIRNHKRMKELQESHALERITFFQRIDEKLYSIGADTKNLPTTKTLFNAIDRSRD